MLSCVRLGSEEIVVISSADGTEIEHYPLPSFATWNFGIGWSHDGSKLVYAATENGISNLWFQPRVQTPPYPFTNFTSGRIFRYAFSPNGERLFVARGYPAQDVMLIQNFR